MTSIERTAYPRFKRLITARELHLFFSPGLEEAQWTAERTQSDEHQLALLLMLKSYQRMGCFPKLGDVPDMVVDFVRRALDLPEGTLATYASGRSAEQHRALVRQRVGVRYDAARARELARETIRAEAESKNNPADLINVALEKLVEAGLELPAYSTLDHMASTVRAEANTAICTGIRERMGEAERSGLLALLDVEDLGPGRKSLFNRLKQPAQRATWSHFRNQANHLEWVDGLGDTGAWLTGVAPGKVTDFAGEAAAADAGVIGSTSVASDSTHFRSWDQNLFTEWHSGYGGRGILVYWHVERGSVVVHSQTLRASASEVHAMVEGAIRHGTTMNVEGNYVDSHGQSEIGFGVTRLLNIDLLPRIKRINKVRLYRPAAGDPGACPRLTPALTRPVTGERHLFEACTIP